MKLGKDEDGREGQQSTTYEVQGLVAGIEKADVESRVSRGYMLTREN